jgi:deoxyribonuclease V
MKLAIDVRFDAEGALAAAVAFDAWDAPEASRTYTSRVPHIEKPRPGEVDLRSLPCILQLLREHALEPDLVLIDGFVDLDTKETPGLGRHLYQALGGRVAVIGVSKSSNPALPPQYEVVREEETRPLLVTSAGIDIGAAKAGLRAMHGRKRVPTLLKLAARVAKGTAA